MTACLLRSRAAFGWVSAVCTLATFAAWIASYWIMVSWAPDPGVFGIVLANGTLSILYDKDLYEELEIPGLVVTRERWLFSPAEGRWLPDCVPLSASARWLMLPMWMPCVAGALATLLFRGARFGRRRGSLACRGCGYSLIGNISGVCPECGTPVPAGAAPPARPADAPEKGNAR